MPELPEVETIRRQLAESIVGATIVGVEVRQERCWGGSREIGGEKIVEIARVGKYLFVKFESGRGLQIHLKMTGRLVVQSQIINSLPAVLPAQLLQAGQILKSMDYETAKHTRVVIKLADGRKIYYWDTRMFGYIRVEEDIGGEQARIRAKLGPDPWEMSETELLRKLQKTGRVIKDAILDQSLLSGVGNIYANDGLWEAGINPLRKANSLRLSEVRKLLTGLRKVMERGLATGGASDNSYVDAQGVRGSYQNEFRVYGRGGEPCHKCGEMLKRIVVSGRGTWVCEHCQR